MKAAGSDDITRLYMKDFKPQRLVTCVAHSTLASYPPCGAIPTSSPYPNLAESTTLAKTEHLSVCSALLPRSQRHRNLGKTFSTRLPRALCYQHSNLIVVDINCGLSLKSSSGSSILGGGGAIYDTVDHKCLAECLPRHLRHQLHRQKDFFVV